MEQNISMQTKHVKTIHKELLLNGGDLDLYLDLFLTDENGKTEKVLTKKADSLLANFLRMLYIQMGRDIRDNVMGGTFYTLRNTITAATPSSNITSISAGVGNKIRLTFQNSVINSSDTTGLITLGGFQGISIDGQYTFTRISDWVIDLEGTTYSAGWTTGTGGVAIYIPVTKIGNPSYQTFYSQGILVGSGSTAVAVDDQLLEKQIPDISTQGGLTYNTSTVSQDTSDATSAQITFTRTFTNNTPNTTQVNEIGMLMYGGVSGTNYYTYLVMRDVIAGGVNVATGKTLTVNYRIKTTLGTGTDPGGFLASFMRLLYRMCSRVQRAVFDINNTSRSYREDATTFNTIKNGGMNKTGYYDEEEGYKHGIVIGTGNTAVSMSDYYLGTPIVHGTGSGQMLYYGGFAEGFTVGAGYAQFNISKAIENNSGGTITVKEYILTGNSDNNTSSATDQWTYPRYLYTLTRNVLTTPVNVLDGEILKVVYTVKVVV
jgi:hypothetical protein